MQDGTVLTGQAAADVNDPVLLSRHVTLAAFDAATYRTTDVHRQIMFYSPM